MPSSSAIAAARAAVNLRRLVADAVPLARQGPTLMGCCPFHIDKTPSFVVYADHYHCYGCGAHGDAIAWIVNTQRISFREAVNLLLGDGTRTCLPLPTLKHPSVRDAERDQRRLELAAAIWNVAVPARGTAAEVYLQYRLGRQSFEIPKVIRFHPKCPRRGGSLPAMIALMTDPLTGDPTGIHRTFLQPDGRGKADVQNPKMMLGRAGIVRLVPDDQITGEIAVAEGIETALAGIHLAEAGPCWATLGAGGMRRFPVIRHVRSIKILSDSDAVGQAAAAACRDRWAGAMRKTRIYVPPDGVGDWLDAALREGW